MIGAHKLNIEKVRIIKDLLEIGEYTHQQIADLFGVSRTLITHINTNKRWDFNNHSFIMKEILNTSNEEKDDEVNKLLDYERKFLREKMEGLIEDNNIDFSRIKSITIHFE